VEVQRRATAGFLLKVRVSRLRGACHFQKMCDLYILQSASGRFFIGSTDDLERRFPEHQRGHTPSTRVRGPWKIAYTETFDSLWLARRRELELKRWKSAKMIKAPYRR
jgi:putative endonuclease